MSNQIIFRAVAGAIVLSAVVGVSAYYLGAKHAGQSQVADSQGLGTANNNTAQKSLAQATEQSQQEARELEARMGRIKKTLAQLDEASEQLNAALPDLAEANTPGLEAAKSQLAALPRTPDQQQVMLPPESSSAKVLAQPKTPSGVPQPVVDNYQQETGVNPAEIEALMRRTQ